MCQNNKSSVEKLNFFYLTLASYDFRRIRAFSSDGLDSWFWELDLDKKLKIKKYEIKLLLNLPWGHVIPTQNVGLIGSAV